MKKKRFGGITNSQYIVLFILACISLIILTVGGIFILNSFKYFDSSTIASTFVPERPATVVKNYVVGTWLDNWVSTCTITIKKINGSYQMTRLYNDGSGETKPLIVRIVGGTEILIENPNSPTGDYMVIRDNGNLAFYDNEGFIYEDYPK